MAVITEGLIPYLDRDERGVLAHNIRQLLRAPGGIWIASDVRTKRSLRGATQSDTKRRADRLSELVGRSLADNLFEDENDLKGFFEAEGFEMREYPYSDIAPELASARSLGLTYKEVQRGMAALRNSKTLVLSRRDD